jgi:hypothetical protein
MNIFIANYNYCPYPDTLPITKPDENEEPVLSDSEKIQLLEARISLLTSNVETLTRLLKEVKNDNNSNPYLKVMFYEDMKENLTKVSDHIKNKAYLKEEDAKTEHEKEMDYVVLTLCLDKLRKEVKNDNSK